MNELTSAKEKQLIYNKDKRRKTKKKRQKNIFKKQITKNKQEKNIKTTSR